MLWDDFTGVRFQVSGFRGRGTEGRGQKTEIREQRKEEIGRYPASRISQIAPPQAL